MQKLTKGPEPVVLSVNGARWTREYVAAVIEGHPKSKERWRHKEIRQALAVETLGKCGYCESAVDHVAYAHVEHIIPKGARPDLAHDWRNLTSACPVCNGNKSDFFDESAPLLDPYSIEVGQISFGHAIADYELGDLRAEKTVLVLDLNRLDLVLRRKARLDSVRRALERWHASSGTLREVLAAAIKQDAIDGEYSTAVREYLARRGFSAP